MAETTRFRKLLDDTTAFWKRHKPKAGSSTVLVGGLIGSAGTTSEIIERGIKGEPMNMWYAAKLVFWFTLAAAKSWELWHQQPPPPTEMIARTSGSDPEGHLR